MNICFVLNCPNPHFAIIVILFKTIIICFMIVIFQDSFGVNFSVNFVLISNGPVKNVEINYEEIVRGKQGGNECKHTAFYNVLINVGTHTIFKEKRKLNLKENFDELIEELKWRSKIQKDVFWKKFEKKILNIM